MKKIKFLTTFTLGVTTLMPLSMTSITSCSNNQALDYSDSDNWIYSKYNGANAKYDLIFIVGTGLMTTDKESGVDIDKPTMKANGLTNFYTTGNQLAYDSNVFVPLYRQVALSYSLTHYTKHNDMINDITNKGSYDDLKSFFNYYFTYINKDAKRPFVLAGHSQGSAAIQVVLENYFIKGGHKSYLKNMIAAYSTGYGISKKWFDSLDKKLDGQDVLHFATGKDDTNCLISWNTEGSGEKTSNFLLADSGDTTLVINPLNWKTDNTLATINENTGVLIPDSSSNNIEVPPGYSLSTKDSDKFNAQIDLTRGSVIVTGHDDKYLCIDGKYIFGGKSLHTWDGKGFYLNMYDNIQTRVNAFINSK